MKWVEIFKIYCLKQIKSEKILFLFTALCILIATSISLIIPVVNLENQRYIEANIKEINGGELSISLNGERGKALEDKLRDFENKGLNVTSATLKNCFYKKSSNNIMGTIVIGDYSLEEDEIIIQSNLANSLNVGVGEFVELDTKGDGKFKYKVKGIEAFSSGVDRDAELVGYGKVQTNEAFKGISGREIIHVNGDNGDTLKEELLKVDNGRFYTTINDKNREVKDELLIQNSTLGILSTVGYIFSILSIITTTIMLILKRKKDIAILRLISIDKKEIKKALGLEISLWLLGPIILSGFLSFYGAKIILNMSGIQVDKITNESFSLILKGMVFNGVIFFILINVALIIVNGINAMAVIREDKKIMEKQKKKILLFTIILIPFLLLAYSLFTGNIEALLSSLVIIILIIVFLALVSLSIKILSIKKFKSPLMMYSIKSIKNNFFSFVLVLLSLTLTLWFILIGFHLESSIKNTFKSSLGDILPYDYYITSKDNEALERVLNSDKDIEGYIKTSDIVGKVINEDFNNMYRSICINEVNEDDYGVKYNILQGKDLFTGDKGFLISDKLRESNALDVGDMLEIETSKGILKGKITGVYESGGINTLGVLKEEVEFQGDISYFVKSKNDNFIDKLNNCSVTGIGDLGDRIAANISGFLKVFRILSIVCLLGTILFNINMVYMNFIKDEKDEEILVALGLGKTFVIKVQLIKMVMLIFLSSILSLGIYALIVNLFFALMINSGGNISIGVIIINLIISIVISIISFNTPLRKILKKKQLNLLREVD